MNTKINTFIGVLTILFALSAENTNAQVGMPTNNPQRNAQLDLNGANSQNNKGLLLPRVSLVSTDNVAPLIGTVLSGMKVYNLATAGSGATAVSPGEYYYDGTKWVRIAAEGSGASGAEPWYNVATQTGATANTQDIYQIGKVGIGKNNPQAQLDVSKDALINGLTVGLAGGQINNNTAVGITALQANSSGIWNTAIGRNALVLNTASYNTATGGNSLSANITGVQNSAFGAAAMQFNTTGGNNSALGYAALATNTTGNENSAVGNSALRNNTTGGSNTAMGANSLTTNTIGVQNSAFGNNALVTNTTGDKNTALGNEAMLTNTTGTWNTAIGNGALQSNTTGYGNTAIGNESVMNSQAVHNVGVGYQALKANVAGASNVAIGSFALKNITGNYNTAIGYQAGDKQYQGDNNIFIGTHALQASDMNGSDQMNIGCLIYGVGMANRYSIGNGSIGIGTKTIGNKLQVKGDIGVSASGNPVSPNVVIGTAPESGTYISGGQVGIQSMMQNLLLSKPFYDITGWGDYFIDFRVGGGSIGGIVFNHGTLGVNYNSDIRLKENIVKSKYGITDIIKMNVFDYNYKADKSKNLNTGVIAQELYNVFPQAVKKGGDDAEANPWSVDYAKIVPLLIKGMQEQQENMNAQKAEIEALKNEVKMLKSK